VKKKYIVELTSEERSELEAMVKKGKAAAYKIKHAHVLLNADQGPEGPGWKDAEIAKTFHCHVTTSGKRSPPSGRTRSGGCYRTG